MDKNDRLRDSLENLLLISWYINLDQIYLQIYIDAVVQIRRVDGIGKNFNSAFELSNSRCDWKWTKAVLGSEGTENLSIELETNPEIVNIFWLSDSKNESS